MSDSNTPISVKLFDDNLLMFTSMIEDIKQATKYIYLETFRFNDDFFSTRTLSNRFAF